MTSYTRDPGAHTAHCDACKWVRTYFEKPTKTCERQAILGAQMHCIKKHGAPPMIYIYRKRSLHVSYGKRDKLMQSLRPVMR